MRVPTTDEMDHTTPEERYKLQARCKGCHEVHKFIGSKDRDNQLKGEVCASCGGTSFYSMCSQRTPMPARKTGRAMR